MQYRAIQKLANGSGVTTGYILQDNFGNTKKMKSQEIKKAIRGHQISVYNLEITYDDKLIHVEKYDKLGLGVMPQEFFDCHGSSYPKAYHLNTGNQIAYTDKSGKTYNMEYALSPDGSKYIVRLINDISSSNTVQISRVDKETIDNDMIMKSLGKLVAIHKETIEKTKNISDSQLRVVDCGTRTPINLNSCSREEINDLVKFRNCRYMFINQINDEHVQIQTENGETISCIINMLIALIKDRALEIRGIAVNPDSSLIIDPYIKTPERDKDYVNRLLGEARKLYEVFKEAADMDFRQGATARIEKEKQAKLKKQEETRKRLLTEQKIDKVSNSKVGRAFGTVVGLFDIFGDVATATGRMMGSADGVPNDLIKRP